jgi:hypothetical protein
MDLKNERIVFKGILKFYPRPLFFCNKKAEVLTPAF